MIERWRQVSGAIAPTEKAHGTGYMEYSLPVGVSFCIADGRTAFLDINRDRYFCVPEQVDVAFQAAAAGELSAIGGEAAITPLLKAGLVQEGRSGSPLAAPQLCKVDQSLRDQNPGRGSRVRTGLAILIYFQMRRQLRRRPLAKILSEIGAHRPTAPAPRGAVNAQLQARAVAEFEAISRVLPMHDACLPRSLSLAKYLARFGCFPKIVFGVRMSPFGAHCWLQDDTMVLNDDAEFVRTYTPIYVL